MGSTYGALCNRGCREKGGGVNSGKEADFKNPLGEGVAFGGPSFGPISRRFPVVIRKLFQQLMLKGRTLN